ncbi:MAG TPA: hypothetical protein VF933_28180 [Streptosporangiaceae bacterium]
MSRSRRPTPRGLAAVPGSRAPAPPHPSPRQAKTTRGAPAAILPAADRATRLAAEWAPPVGRILLGLVLAWFGYHELVRPGLWTGYVPVLPPASGPAVILVLAHGWVLLVLAVALIAGVAPRTAAAVAAILVLEIVISLTATGGLSDLTLRDVGVLGLAICLTGVRQQRLLLSR